MMETDVGKPYSCMVLEIRAWNVCYYATLIKMVEQDNSYGLSHSTNESGTDVWNILMWLHWRPTKTFQSGNLSYLMKFLRNTSSFSQELHLETHDW
jgi:hypothetical protein